MLGLALFGACFAEVAFDRKGSDVVEAVMFDSLEAARELEAAGVERNHAAAVVKTVVTATEAGRKDLATKTDLAQLESRLEAKFSALEIKFAGLEAKFAALETRFAAAINKMVLSQLAVAGLLFAALKLF